MSAYLFEKYNFLPSHIAIASLEEEEKKGKKKKNEGHPTNIPIIPTTETIIFPGVVTPIPLKEKAHLSLFRKAYEKKQLLGMIASKKEKRFPHKKELYQVGTTFRVLRVVNLSTGQHLVLVEGKRPFKLLHLEKKQNQLYGQVSFLEDPSFDMDNKSNQALVSSLREVTHKILKKSSTSHKELMNTLENPLPPKFLVYYIAANLTGFSLRQRLLTLRDLRKRAEALLKYLLETLKFTKLKSQIQDKLQSELTQEQRDHFLRKQIKALQSQLDEESEDPRIKKLMQKAKTKTWSIETQKHFEEVLEQLTNSHPHGHEYSTNLRYAKLLVDLPWGTTTKDREDLKEAAAILEKKHYGMEKVKERLLENLAVHMLKKGKDSSVLCLLGPPGVGKTTIAKSIAKALGRKFFKISLAGMHDEAKLLGHSRTYVASKEGALLAGLKQVESANPVILLDEIDKIDYTRSSGGDSILAILDPSQQQEFKDNYMDIPFDISQVLFIATANDESELSWPLHDRLEIIELEGYALEEKQEIAQKYIIPEQQEKHGLAADDFSITDKALERLIQDYTSESGVRQLSRQVQALCRKVAKNKLAQTSYEKEIQPKDLRPLLDIPKYEEEEDINLSIPGKAIGLSWSEVGGGLVSIEATAYSGKGDVTLSGKLGEVMQESAHVALSLIRSQAETFKIDPRLFKQYDLHIHSSPGFVSKEGPSAGITLTAAILSLYTQRKLKDKTAMTGEITLQGKILAVGGIKEKVLAAKRNGIAHIILSKQNQKHVEQIKKKYIRGLKFYYVENFTEALPILLETKKIPKAKKWQLAKEKD